MTDALRNRLMGSSAFANWQIRLRKVVVDEAGREIQSDPLDVKLWEHEAWAEPMRRVLEHGSAIIRNGGTAHPVLGLRTL